MPHRFKRLDVLDTERHNFPKMTLGQERDGTPSENYGQPPTISIQSFLSVKELHQHSVYFLETWNPTKRIKLKQQENLEELKALEIAVWRRLMPM